MSLFERVQALYQPENGLDGYAVFHSTARGPATGGIRFYPYASDEDALRDGIRLARAMTFKAAAAELPVGGGKIVVKAPPASKRHGALRAIGRTLETLDGEFYAGRDVGVPVEDGAVIRSETRFMVDESPVDRGGVGDLNRATALGVLAGARAALAHRVGAGDLRGVRVALQGAGGVGAWLAKELAAEGAELVVCDTNPTALAALEQSVSFRRVAADDIYGVECELFAPCAIGGVLTDVTARELRALVVAGSANNPLEAPAIDDVLAERGILYAPDYLVNAGALIQGVRFLLHGEQEALDAIIAIGDKTQRLLARAQAAGLTPLTCLQRELASEFDLLDTDNL